MKFFFIILACSLSAGVFAQTKLIAFRSHSGSDAHFRQAVEHYMFNMDGSNFGLPAREYITKVHRVLLKRKNQIVISYTLYATHYNNKKFKPLLDTTTTFAKATAPGLFKAVNVANLKAGLLKYRSMIVNPVFDSTQFIGFDNKFNMSKKAAH